MFFFSGCGIIDIFDICKCKFCYGKYILDDGSFIFFDLRLWIMNVCFKFIVCIFFDINWSVEYKFIFEIEIIFVWYICVLNSF